MDPSPDQLLNADTETWQRVIAELALDAPNLQIKNCIKTYDPEKSTKENSKELNKLNKPVIMETLEFLSRQTVEKENKDDLVQKLCLKIKNYFPDICQICNVSYTFQFQDQAFMHCSMCGQEVHKTCYLKLLKEMNLVNENETVRKLFNIPGIFFLCPNCQVKTILFPSKTEDYHDDDDNGNDDDDNQDDSENKDNDSSHQSKSKTVNQSPRRTLPLTPKIVVDDKQNFVGRTEFMKRKFQKDNEYNSTITSKNTTNKSTTKEKLEEEEEEESVDATDYDASETQICNFYKRGKCKHGLKGRNCKYKHPKACQKLMKYGNKGPNGCKMGIRCSNFHPRMCSSSIKQGKCFNPSCSFAHIKGTKQNLSSQYNKNQDPTHNPTKTQNFQNKEMNFLIILEKLKSDILQEMDQKIATMISAKTDNFTQRNLPIQYNQPYHHQPHQQELNNNNNNNMRWDQPQNLHWDLRQNPNMDF